MAEENEDVPVLGVQIPAAVVLNFAQDLLEDTVWLRSSLLDFFPPSPLLPP